MDWKKYLNRIWMFCMLIAAIWALFLQQSLFRSPLLIAQATILKVQTYNAYENEPITLDGREDVILVRFNVRGSNEITQTRVVKYPVKLFLEMNNVGVPYIKEFMQREAESVFRNDDIHGILIPISATELKEISARSTMSFAGAKYIYYLLHLDIIWLCGALVVSLIRFKLTGKAKKYVGWYAVWVKVAGLWSIVHFIVVGFAINYPLFPVFRRFVLGL